MNKHKEVEELIRNKIAVLRQKDNRSEKDNEELEKFQTLYDVFTNPYESFLEQVSIDVVINVLRDIGVPKEKTLLVYSSLVKEEINKKYILKDINLESKHSKDEEDER